METVINITPIAEKNDTALNVFGILAQRQRYRKDTNLDKLRDQMRKEGMKLVDDDFKDLFVQLKKAGIGHLVTGPRKEPRFKWYYNLKDVAKSAIMNTPLTTDSAFRKTPGRPIGSIKVPQLPTNAQVPAPKPAVGSITAQTPTVNITIALDQLPDLLKFLNRDK